MIRWLLAGLLLAPALPAAAPHAHADTLHVLTAGAYRPVLMALAPAVEQETGHRLEVENATAGTVAARIQAGETPDLVVLPQTALPPGTGRPLAQVGIGVAVPLGAPKPDISTEAAFRAAVLAARAPAWIDPASGGSSGIVLSRLFQRWGIAAELAPRAVLVPGGLVGEQLRTGRADLAIHQLSELAAVPGIAVVGPLPASIQSTTVYAGTVPPGAAHPAAAAAVLDRLAHPDPALLRAHAMEPAQ